MRAECLRYCERNCGDGREFLGGASRREARVLAKRAVLSWMHRANG
jgi:hypothetical protein